MTVNCENQNTFFKTIILFNAAKCSLRSQLNFPASSAIKCVTIFLPCLRDYMIIVDIDYLVAKVFPQPYVFVDTFLSMRYGRVHKKTIENAVLLCLYMTGHSFVSARHTVFRLMHFR